MDSIYISQQFYIKLYHWLLNDVSDEAANDFPLYRRIKVLSTIENIEVIRQLNEAEKLSLVSTFVRKAFREKHGNLLELINESWNESDEHNWKKFLSIRAKIDTYKWSKESRAIEDTFPVDLLLIRQAIIQKLSFLDNITFKDEGYKLIYSFEINNWRIDAVIELRQPPAIVLNYSYTIQGYDFWKLTERNIDFLNYLGIYDPWKSYNMEDLSETTDVISMLFQKFYKALIEILEKISQPQLSSQELSISRIRELSDSFQRKFFKQRYYWSLNDSIREVNESFPLVSRINNHWAIDALSSMNNLSKTEKNQAAIALVKYAHWSCLDSNNLLTNNETNILLNSKREGINPLNNVSSLICNVRELTITKSCLKNLIKKKLKPVVGSVFQSDKNAWKHEIKINSWKVVTYIELDGCQLSYWHNICDAETGIFTAGTAHILGWLGIGESYWNIFTDMDALEAVDSLFAVCEHFIQALPMILGRLDASEAVNCMKNIKKL
jgi:hypothetical protein